MAGSGTAASRLPECAGLTAASPLERDCEETQTVARVSYAYALETAGGGVSGAASGLVSPFGCHCNTGVKGYGTAVGART